MRSLVSAVVGPWMTEIYRWRTRVSALPVRPAGEPVAHAPGLDPDRVLITGNGLAVGWGVLIHDLAIPGHLARALTAATRHGSEVRVHADPDMTITTAIKSLSAVRLGVYDAIVLVIGASDAFQLISRRRWSQHMTLILDALKDGAGVTPVLIVGIPPLSTIPFFRTRPEGLIDRWAERLNTITRTLCDAYHTIGYVPPDWTPALHTEGHGNSDDRYRIPEDYRQVAERIVDALLPLLRTETAGVHHHQIAPGQAQSDQDRRAALAQLGILDTAPEDRFDHIVQMARTVFGTEGAAFTLIDEDRQWHKAVVGITRREDPLEDSFCASAIQSAISFVVLDARHDDRPLPHTKIRFYAGHPVEAPDGTRIGTICVFDSSPRSATTPAELSFLRELALTIQHELTQFTATEY